MTKSTQKVHDIARVVEYLLDYVKKIHGVEHNNGLQHKTCWQAGCYAHTSWKWHTVSMHLDNGSPLCWATNTVTT